MQHLKELLISLQTFDLKMLPSKEFKNDPLIAETGLPMYDISHQIKVSKFGFDLRKLTDFATVDLLMLDSRRIKLAIVEFNKLKDRFDSFWKKYNLYYRGRSFTKYHFHSLYWDNYFILIRLPFLFTANNLRASSPDILITGKFVDDLGESVRLREAFLAEITQHATSLIAPEEPHLAGPMEASERPSRKDVKKQPDGTYVIVPVLRTKRNYSSGR